MYNKKTIFMITMALTLMLGQTMPSVAAEISGSEINNISAFAVSPRWNDTNIVQPSISNSGKSITVSLFIAPKKNTEKSSGTLYLEQYSGGKWSSATSWSINKTGNVDVSKTYTGKSGVKYRTKAVITVGTDKITVSSEEITIK